VEDYGAKIIYGDTDSTMFVMPGIEGSKCIDEGERLEHILSKNLPKPMYLEFEKAGRMFCVTPKRYVFWRYKHSGEFEPKKDMLIRGLLVCRRDKCKWIQTIYKNVLDMILTAETYENIHMYILEEVVKFVEDKISISNLSISCSVAGYYKSASFPLAIFKERMKARGKPISPGQRIEYVYVKNDEIENPKAGDLMEPVEEVLDREEEFTIDYARYIENLLTKPVDQIVSIAYQNKTPVGYILEVLKLYDFKLFKIMCPRFLTK